MVAPLIYKDSTKLLERNSFIQINTTEPTNTLNQNLTIRNKSYPKIITTTTTTTKTTTSTTTNNPLSDIDDDSTTLRLLDLSSDEDNVLSEPTEPVTEYIPITERSLPIIKPTTTSIQFQSTRKQVQSNENKNFKNPFIKLLQQQLQPPQLQPQSNLIDENVNNVHNNLKINESFEKKDFGSTIDFEQQQFINNNNVNTDFKPRPFSKKTRLPVKRVPNVTGKRNIPIDNDKKVSEEVDQEARFSKRRNSVLSPSEVETILISTTNRPILEYTPGYRGSVRYRTTTISSVRYDPNNSLRSKSNDNNIIRTRVSTERTQSPLTTSTTQRTRSPVSLTSSAIQTSRTTSRIRPTFTSKTTTTTTATTPESILSIIPEASDRFNLDLSEADKRPDRLRFELKLGRKIDFGFSSLKPNVDDKVTDASKVRILTGPLDKSPISGKYVKGYVEEIPLKFNTTASYLATTVKPFANQTQSLFVQSVLDDIQKDEIRRIKIQNQNQINSTNSLKQSEQTISTKNPILQLSTRNFEPKLSTKTTPTTTTTTT